MRRFVLAIDKNGELDVVHDNFSAEEMAVFALVVHDMATRVLRDGPTGHIQDGGSDDSSGGG
jgi:hypothetical protein